MSVVATEGEEEVEVLLAIVALRPGKGGGRIPPGQVSFFWSAAVQEGESEADTLRRSCAWWNTAPFPLKYLTIFSGFVDVFFLGLED